MAHSPAVLNGFASLEGGLADHATLSEAQRQAIRLAIAGYQDCHYGQSAYTMAGKAAGLTEEQTVELRGHTASFNDALDALVRFAVEALDRRGYVDDATWQRALEAGWRDDQLLEAFANAARTFLTSGFNHLVGTAPSRRGPHPVTTPLPAPTRDGQRRSNIGITIHQCSGQCGVAQSTTSASSGWRRSQLLT